MKSLHRYLSLNPSIHLLPPVALRCLASLFAVSINLIVTVISNACMYNNVWNDIKFRDDVTANIKWLF